MSAAATVRDYYEALREGKPLAPFFVDHPDVVKFGIGERLTGYDEVAAGLREQTRTTTDWRVESSNLRVIERGRHAWFSDDVFMEWRDAEAGREYAFNTRWSGSLERNGDDDDDEGEWSFLGMHVSTPWDWDADQHGDGVVDR